MDRANRTVRDPEAMYADYDRQLAALRAEVAALRRERPRRRPRRLLPLALVALVVALVPMGILAANPFDDLTGGVHDPNIDLIYNAGITTGCVPNASYCPEDFVTREQMATFLARTAGLGTNPPIVNAKTAQTATSATTATTANSAGKLGTTPVGTTTYAANEIARSARAVGTNVRDQNELVVTSTLPATAFNPVATLTITAPTAGFVIVNSTVGIGIEGTSTAGFARLRDTTPGITPVPLPSPTLYLGTNAESLTTTLSPTYIFPVAAGSRTFVLEVQKSGAGEVRAFDGVIAAVFIPFGAAGATGAEGE